MKAAPYDLPRDKLSARLARDPGLVVETARHFGEFIEQSGLSGSEAFQLRLVLSEVLNNLVEHVQASKATGAIEVHCRIDAGSLFLEIRDGGPAMQRLPAEEFPDSLSDRGRGWPIIQSWADEVRYRRDLGHNVLEMKRTTTTIPIDAKR